MRRAPLLEKLLCVGLLMGLGGCHFFGIDTRKGIEYVTVNERKTVKEPMYTRSVPGTNLVKRWPKRLGIDYGYAPWERKRDPQSVAANTTAGTAPTDPVSPYPASQHLESQHPVSAANGAPAAIAADDWQGRGNTVQQASVDLPAGGAELPASGATGVTGRPLDTATDSSAPMRFDPLMPIDKTILPGYSPYALPVMSEPAKPRKLSQPAGNKKLQPAGNIKPEGAGGIKQPNPLRLRP